MSKTNKRSSNSGITAMSVVIVMLIGAVALMMGARTLPPLELSLVSDFARPVDPARAVDEEFIERLMDQVVYIRNDSGTGSGVIINSECGLILTAAHGECDELQSYVYLNDGRIFEVPIDKVTKYPAYDLAVLDLEVDLLVAVSPVREGFPAIGEEIIVIGSPAGWKYFNTVSFGRISGLLRRMEGLPHLFWYQTDATINRGNSGGPWFDMQGRLIAVTLKKSSMEGISFGLPIRYLAEAREEAQAK